MDDLRWSFLGFLPRHVVRTPDWLPATVVEVCSVSECISPGPEDRIGRWLHNEAGFYDTEGLAQAVVPSGSDEFELFAYRIAALCFDETRDHEAWDPRQTWSRLPIEPDLSGYTSLGFDLVGRGVSDFFECSPLSCNRMAGELATNASCLIDEIDRAIEIGRMFGRRDSHVEPASYHLVEVLRGC